MRRFVTVLFFLTAIVAAKWLQSPGVVAGTTFVFPLSIKGKSWQTDVILNPGVKPPIGKVNDKAIAGVLQETLPDFAAQFLDLDPDGRFFLLYDGKESWRVATNTGGTLATTLTGKVANDGTFWMSGTYSAPMGGAMGSFFATGKVKFVKGTFDPKKVSGALYFVSDAMSTGLTLKFKTVGAPFA
jgi:hypothetical protein